MSDVRLRISLVIPVYNEESHLADCLRLALAQRLPFYEIIVVDNNSTDATRKIAQQFDHVRVASEKQQGVVYARGLGFDIAKGDIIARIDADTRMPSDWTKKLVHTFRNPEVSAVSGAITYDDISCAHIVNIVDLRIRSWLSRRMSAHRYLLGSNMAIRKSAWHAVRTEVCTKGNQHEDLDLAAHLGDAQLAVAFDPTMIVGTSGRRADTPYRSFLTYLVSMPRSYAQHDLHEQRYMYPVIGFVALVYPLLRLFYRSFDTDTASFSWRKLLMAPAITQRVNPTTFVD